MESIKYHEYYSDFWDNLINAKRGELEGFLKLLDGRKGLLAEFDESLWLGIVDSMKVHSKKEYMFVLKDGTEICWER